MAAELLFTALLCIPFVGLGWLVAKHGTAWCKILFIIIGLFGPVAILDNPSYRFSGEAWFRLLPSLSLIFTICYIWFGHKLSLPRPRFRRKSSYDSYDPNKADNERLRREKDRLAEELRREKEKNKRVEKERLEEDKRRKQIEEKERKEQEKHQKRLEAEQRKRLEAERRKKLTAKDREEDPSDPYTLLGVTRATTFTQIRKAYMTLAKQYHPDSVAFLGDEAKRIANEKFKALKSAYEAIEEDKGQK